MKFFIIEYQYRVSLERVAEVVEEHRAHLQTGYDQGWFLASGPQNPKTGGLVIARAPELGDIEEFLSRDPFITNGIAEPRIIEFEPVKRHPEMASFFTA